MILRAGGHRAPQMEQDAKKATTRRRPSHRNRYGVMCSAFLAQGSSGVSRTEYGSSIRLAVERSAYAVAEALLCEGKRRDSVDARFTIIERPTEQQRG